MTATKREQARAGLRLALAAVVEHLHERGVSLPADVLEFRAEAMADQYHGTHDQSTHGLRGGGVGDDDDVMGGRKGVPIAADGKLYYHGTTREAAEAILRDGLKSELSGKNWGEVADAGQIFITRNIDEAKYWAEFAMQEQGVDGMAIVNVAVPKGTVLVTDPDVKGGQSAAYGGPIPAGWIKSVALYDKQGGFVGAIKRSSK